MEEFKLQLKELKKKLREAEKRAIQAERTVKKLLKEVDMKEGRTFSGRGLGFSLPFSVDDNFLNESQCFRRAERREGEIQSGLRRHGRHVRRNDRILKPQRRTEFPLFCYSELLPLNRYV